MSYLAQELVGLNLNYHPQDFHVHDDQETLPVSSSSSLKRKLPVPLTSTVTPSKGQDSDDAYQEPFPKRISLRNNEDPCRGELREDIHYALSGFNKISLPDVSTTSTPLYPPPNSSLRRTVSDCQTIAHRYFFNQESDGYKQGFRDFLRPASQENFTFGTSNAMAAAPSRTKADGVPCGFVSSSPSLSPLPPSLRRTLSDPSPSPNELFQKGTADSEGIVEEQSPNAKRLEKMKLQIQEMGKWWAQVLREADVVEEEEDNQDGPNQQCTNKHDLTAKVQGGTTEEDEDVTTGTEMEKETTQEAVSVEMLGECLSINFSCPCNKGYRILLAGKNCYYKLV